MSREIIHGPTADRVKTRAAELDRAAGPELFTLSQLPSLAGAFLLRSGFTAAGMRASIAALSRFEVLHSLFKFGQLNDFPIPAFIPRTAGIGFALVSYVPVESLKY